MINNSLRIISGKYKNRKINFVAPVRPTTNRIRETLFNWLQNDIQGARCLDLFAGSGSLSIEALSRGALAVTALEVNPNVFRQLQKEVQRLAINELMLLNSDALSWLSSNKLTFDIVFVDPPYADNLAPKILTSINWPCICYVEQNTILNATPLWEIIKEGKAGHVHYYLLSNHHL